MKQTCRIALAMILSLLAASAGAVIHEVAVAPGGALTFSPADIAIAVGDTVHWVWQSGGHNVASGLPGSPTPYFYSGAPAVAGTTFDVVFDMPFIIANPAPGFIYDYYCEPHGQLFGMVGSVSVNVETGMQTDDVTWAFIKSLYR